MTDAGDTSSVRNAGIGAAPGSLILAIETSNPSAMAGCAESDACRGVALGRVSATGAVEPLGVERLNEPTRRDDDLMCAVDRLFRAYGCGAADLKDGRIAVSVGPGGYTSLRMACAAAKMISMASGAGCVAVRSADVAYMGMAESVRADATVVVALASKGATGGREASAVLAAYAAGEAACACAEVVTASQARTWLERAGVKTDGVLVADGHLPEAFREAAGELGMRLEPMVLRPSVCLVLGAVGQVVDVDALVPAYGRLPDVKPPNGV